MRGDRTICAVCRKPRHDGFSCGEHATRLAERAAIVAWLRSHGPTRALDERWNALQTAANAIEAGHHLAREGRDV